MTLVLTHVVALYAVVIAPWLGCFLFEQARRRIRAGDPLAKVTLYRLMVIEQVVGTMVVLWLCFSGAISTAYLGLGAPRSAWLTTGLSAAIGTLLLWSGLRLRPKAHKIREKLKDRPTEILLPDTLTEQRWLATVSIGAGISEELIFRGFLFYYLSLWFPYINGLECALITSLTFGLGHLYQGWKGVVGTALVGLIMAGLYLLTGNLLVPVIAHATTDLRALLIFWNGIDQQAMSACE
jgi:uncharacterized protein